MANLIFSGKITEDELARVRRDIDLIRPLIKPAAVYGKKKTYTDKSFRDCLIYHLKQEQSPFIFNCLNSYILELYSWTDLDLTEMPEVQFSRYEKGGKFNWHRDDIRTGKEKIRGFTFVMNLSDPDSYRGGELLVQVGDQQLVLDKSPGSFIIFPSILRHMACEVKSGVRESLVLWTHFNKQDIKWIEKNAS